jgi:hypothetical protein
MSQYNRIQSPLHEAVALIKVLQGTAVIVLDEEETREYKSYASLVPYTMGSICKNLKKRTNTV